MQEYNHKDFPTIISFFTQDWKYPEYAEKLKKKCDALGLRHHIIEVPNQGDYLKNCCYKPTFIYESLNRLKTDVLWIDVDGDILKTPNLLRGKRFNKADFAAKKMNANRSRTWHVGTMWFNYTDPMLHFLQKWIALTGSLSDESSLEEAWKLYGRNISYYELPQEYFIIPKWHGSHNPNAVIVHTISDGESKTKVLRERKKRKN